MTLEEMKENGRRIKELDSVIVRELKKAETSIPDEVEIGNYAPVSFPMNAIPESLKDLFISRLNVLWGEISAVIDNEKHYYYVKDFRIDGDHICAQMMKNW